MKGEIIDIPIPDQTMCGYLGNCPNKATWHSVVSMADLDPEEILVIHDFMADDVYCLASCDEHIGYVHSHWSHYITHAFDIPCAFPGVAVWDDDGCFFPEEPKVESRTAVLECV